MNFDLDNFLPYKLSLATNTVSQRLAKEYEAFKITRTQWRILAVLGSAGEVTAQGIANKTMMDKTTLSRAIKKLVERKLVSKKSTKTDGRATHLYLTPEGQDLFASILPVALQTENQIRAKLSPTEMSMFENILERLAEDN